MAITHSQTASSFDLWQERIDPQGTISREEFDAMSLDSRIAIITEAFGPEQQEIVPTIENVLDSNPISWDSNGNRLVSWEVNGGWQWVPYAVLRQALEDAYDPSMPNWPAMVDCDSL